MDLTNAMAAAEGQTVQPGDFNTGTQRTTPSAPLAGAGGGGGSPPTPQPAQPQQQPVGPGGQVPPMPQPAGGPQPQPRPAAPTAGTQPGSATAVPPPGQPAAGQAGSQQAWNLRNQLQQIGFDTSGMADDHAAWDALATRLAQWNQSAQQNAQLAQYGQFYLANKAKFDALLQQGATPAQAAGAINAQQQGGQQAPAQQPGKNLFGAPEFNPEWMKVVSFDPNTGKAVVPLGYDPSIGPKVDQYVSWRKDAFEKFLQDPMAMLKDGIMPLIQEEARKLAQSTVGGYDDAAFARNYVASQPWIFQKDAQGQQIMDVATGQPLLTPAGLRFRQFVTHAQQAGIGDIRQQAEWATAMVEREAALWQLQQYQGQGQQAAGGGNPPAGQGQQQGQQHAPGSPAAVNAQQQAAALGMGGARRIAGGGGNSQPVAPAAGAGGAPARRPLGRGALRNRLQGALQQAGIN